MNRRLKLGSAAIVLATLACTLPFGFTFGDGGPLTRGSGDEVTVTPGVTGFDSLDVSHSFEVDIIQSQTYSLVIDVDDNIEEYLIVDVRGDTLVLGLEEGRSYINVTLRAQISMPELSALEMSGASKVKFAQFESLNPFDLVSSGASEVEGDIDAGDVTIKLSGASDLRLEGEGGDLLLESSGASHVNLEGFIVQDATLDLTGASDVAVNVNGELNVEASGASEVTFFGDPTLGDISTSGASDIQKGD